MAIDEAAMANSHAAAWSARLRQAIRGEFWAHFGVPVAFGGIIVFFTFASDAFLTTDNLVNVLRQSAVIGIAAIGATVVLISGGIDISQGATMAVAGVVTVTSVEWAGLHDLIAILFGVLAGVIVGAINGILAERVRIPAFIATLGTLLVFRGVVFVMTEARSIGLTGDSGPILRWVGRGFLGPIPVPVVIMLVLFAVGWWITRRTVWGLHTYAAGSSAVATRIAGVRVERHRIGVYTVAGACSAMAGVVLAGRLASAAPAMATGAEFDILAAVVLGGTSIYGGKGNVLQTLLGVVLLVTLSNGLILLNVPSFYQMITSGLVLLAALALGQFRSRG